MDNSGPPITPSSEIIHLVSTFADSLDSLPPSLTRCLSDLKELDAVLSGALGSITAKLTLLSTMMATPPPGTSSTSADAPMYTPFDRLKLLREVAEDARIFRLGGEDKIRVATGTCETIATHTSHLSTLSTLLLTFLPSHMLPMLPPPSAPHGYPSSLTPSSALARRQIFDYPPSQHAGSGSTTRMSGALGMVREHWDMTRGRSGTKRRPAMLSGPLGMDDMGAGLRHDRERALKDMHKDPSVRHPNQYTKKRLQEQAAAAARVNHGASSGGLGGGLGVASGSSNTIYSSAPAHPFGMTAIDSVKSKRANENGGHIHSQSMHSQHGVNGNGNGGGSIGSNGERSGSISGASGGMLYAGMASQDEYNAATAGGGRTTKRKTDDAAAASKRRKTKAPDALMEPLDVSPLPSVTASKSRRTVGSTKLPLDAAPLPLPIAQQYIGEEQFEGEIDEDGDGQTYCICHRVSFGEMIGCDGTECEKEWFHLPCVGLSAIPKGRWFCDDCRKKAADKAKKRR